MPKGNLSIYEKVHDVVQAMSRSGRVVSLPFDLRVGFARYVARANISAIKRYAIAPVFRERIAVQVRTPNQNSCTSFVNSSECHSTLGYFLRFVVQVKKYIQQ